MNKPKPKTKYKNVVEYNNSRLLAADILTGKQFRNLKRAGKLPA